ncbi:MAG: polysaccharide deacetylase family protein [Actinomycetia bacterium]|nr:polysaccharide deacetylase family protein [Actinomycetes bacterium]
MTVQHSRPTVVCYHDPSPDTLRRHLAFLASRYSFVPLREIVEWLYQPDHVLPPRALALTLDDGWAGNLRLAPVFADFCITPTVFVCTQVVGTRRRFWFQFLPDGDEKERLKRAPDDVRLARLVSTGYSEFQAAEGDPVALSAEQLEAIGLWADIQSHTRLHPILPMCDDARVRSEIEGSRAELVDLLGGHDVYAIAYPNGDCSAREVGIAKAAGYRCAFTISPHSIAPGDDPFMLPRVWIPDNAGQDELAVRLSGAHRSMRHLLRRLLLIPEHWT